jgi:hypothetical protein
VDIRHAIARQLLAARPAGTGSCQRHMRCCPPHAASVSMCLLTPLSPPKPQPMPNPQPAPMPAAQGTCEPAIWQGLILLLPASLTKTHTRACKELATHANTERAATYTRCCTGLETSAPATACPGNGERSVQDPLLLVPRHPYSNISHACDHGTHPQICVTFRAYTQDACIAAQQQHCQLPKAPE